MSHANDNLNSPAASINSSPASLEQKHEQLLRLLAADGRFSAAEAAALARFAYLVLKKNEVMNLTAITAAEDFYVKHLLDSLSLLPLLDKYAAGPADQTGASFRLLDVGSGAGFPGIPLKIMRPEADITLLDSLRKRCLFLDEVIADLKLGGIRSLHSRAEDAGRQKKLRDSFDFVTARAVAALPVLLELCLPLVKPGGYFLAMKANDEELSAAAKALKLLNGEWAGTEKFSLPGEQGERALLLFRKTGPTPARFPRKAGTPGKQPLL